MSINKGLERLTREQSLEIKNLRKQLRQSLRLSAIGPQSSNLPEDSASEDEEEAADDSFEMEDGELDFRLGLDKSIFLVEQMLAEGRKGLDYRVDASDLTIGGRVISQE